MPGARCTRREAGAAGRIPRPHQAGTTQTHPREWRRCGVRGRVGGLPCARTSLPELHSGPGVRSLVNGDLTLLNADGHGDTLTRAIDALVARQGQDGGWALAPRYRGAVAPIRYGSRAITTALGLEALGKFLDRQAPARGGP